MIKPCSQCGKELKRSPSQFLNRQNNPCPIFCSKECKKIWTFWSQVEKTPTCWNWKGSKNSVRERKNGSYGVWTKRKEYVHRFSYILHYGQPKNLVLHKCNNKKCVNPAHLYDGTYKDNTRDAIQAGVKYQWTKETRPLGFTDPNFKHMKNRGK